MLSLYVQYLSNPPSMFISLVVLLVILLGFFVLLLLHEKTDNFCVVQIRQATYIYQTGSPGFFTTETAGSPHILC